jgi:hypothetical protein
LAFSPIIDIGRGWGLNFLILTKEAKMSQGSSILARIHDPALHMLNVK